MAKKLFLSEKRKDKDGLVKFQDPKSTESVRTFPSASVYFKSGGTVHGYKTTPALRRIRG
jgi:hypothetical protein